MVLLKKKIKTIGIIGIGYVGLPLSIELSKYYIIIAYDKDSKKIKELNNSFDRTNEINTSKINKQKIKFTSSSKNLQDCDAFIITVPTPIDGNNRPDLSFLKDASKLVAKKIKRGALIIYESTVYPGCTEEICVPIIEKFSSLKLNTDFHIGYSPERVNPGDSSHSLTKISKIISASSLTALDSVYSIYSKIIKAKIHKTSNIQTAEAAKVIENIQRDLNIGLMNELSQIFEKLNINTNEVIEAASTKWNFMKFHPGLVGGHCIGVDPYYLTYKAKLKKFNPKIILSARQTNNNMPNVIANNIFKIIQNKKLNKKNLKVLIMGLTFKENCRDIRNSKVFDLYNHLNKKFKTIDIYDPNVNISDLNNFFKNKIKKNLRTNYYDVIIISVKHKIFKEMSFNNISMLLNQKGIIIDLLNLFPKYKKYWKL